MKSVSIFLLAAFILLLIMNVISINNDIERKNAECMYWKEKTLIEKKELDAILESLAQKDSLHKLIINKMNNK